MNNDQYTIKEYFVEVGDGHSLYVQDWGNKKTKTPIIFLHGGPGSGVKDKHKGVFDPNIQRVIFFDQRGSGRSLPYGEIGHNTTKVLVEDIELLAKHLKLDDFILHGTSWGSALALFYAIKYPKRVKALVIGGVYTGTKSETDWLDKGLFVNFYPDAWDKYLTQTPISHHDNPSAYHFKNALGKNEDLARRSAYAYSCLEHDVMTLDDRVDNGTIDEFDPVSSRIEMHYLANHCFMPDKYILSNAKKLTMPIWLVQGRYDMVCPPITAYKLYKQLPNSQLIWTIAGHKSEHESWNIMRTIMLQLVSEK